MAKKLTSNKAKEILHDKSVHGHPLTDKQRRFFGAIAGGAKPYEDGGWLDKYEDGGLILKKKTKDNYGTTPNANAGHSTANEGWIGEGTTNRGFDYNGAWGGTMQDGGILGKTFLQPNDPKLPKGWNPEAKGYSTEYSTTIGKDGQYYLVPGFKHGKLLSDPEKEFHNTGEFLGGPFKTIQSAEDFANRRHKYVEQGKPLPSPMKTYDEFQLGGIITNNPNDPRIKAYQDSLSAYETGKAWSSFLKNIPDYKYKMDDVERMAEKYRLSAEKSGAFDKGVKDKSGDVKEDIARKIYAKDSGYKAYWSPVVKKPVQPVEYQAPKTEVKKVKGSKKFFINDQEVPEDLFMKVAPVKHEMQMGGSMPGAVGFMYARTQNPAPANGKYTKKTLASAQKGKSIEVKTNDPAFKNMDPSILKNINSSDIEAVRSDILGYLNSDLYKQRQKNIPEQSYIYPNYPINDYYAQNIEDYKKRFTNDISNLKQTQRFLNLSTVKSKLSNLGIANDEYKGSSHTAYINNKGANSIIAHELSHSLFADGNDGLTSDYDNSKYYNNQRSIPNIFLNQGEQAYLNDLNKNKDPKLRDDTHYNGSLGGYSANESYSDLMAFRQLLKDNGITKKFGDNITDKDFQKALKIKNIANDPNFKRMRLKYKDEHIPVINNIIAKSDNNIIPEAQNGQEMKFWQEGLDWQPKTISQNGSVIKDDRGQWAHPGEITEIGSPDITMQGVDYPVLGVSDTGDTKMMQPGQDYKFDGNKVTEYPMMQEGGWMDKYQPEPMRQDATRNVIPRKMTEKEKLEAAAASDQAQKRALNTAKEMIAERRLAKSKKPTLGEDKFQTEEKLRFPGTKDTYGGWGDVANEYLNPAFITGELASNLANSRSAKEVAMNLAVPAGLGVLGMDPLGSTIEGVKGIPKATRAGLNTIDRNFSEVGKQLVQLEKEGIKKGLSPYEIKKLQMKKVGITSGQREAYVPGISDALEKYIFPQGYGGRSESKLAQTLKAIKTGIREKSLPAREDAWSLYLGKPQKSNTFRMAETAPVNHPAYTPEQLSKMDIYSINDEAMHDGMIYNNLEGIAPRAISAETIGLPEYTATILEQNSEMLTNPISHDYNYSVMGGYNKRLNQYGLEYNDIWDLEPELFGKKVQIDKFIGKPFMSHEVLTDVTPENVKSLLTSQIRNADAEFKSGINFYQDLIDKGSDYSKILGEYKSALNRVNKLKQPLGIDQDIMRNTKGWGTKDWNNTLNNTSGGWLNKYK